MKNPDMEQFALYESWFMGDKTYFWNFFREFIEGTVVKFCYKRSIIQMKDELIQEGYIIVGKLMSKYNYFFGDRTINIFPYIYANFEINLWAVVRKGYTYSNRVSSIEEFFDIQDRETDSFPDLDIILEHVAPIDKKIILMTLDGYKQHEIATVLGCKQSWISVRIRAFAKRTPYLDRYFKGYKMFRELYDERIAQEHKNFRRRKSSNGEFIQLLTPEMKNDLRWMAAQKFMEKYNITKQQYRILKPKK